MDFVNLIMNHVACSINTSNQSIAHRIDHIKRVLSTALIISKNYPNVDNEVLSLAVLLHDIDQPYNNKLEHVKKSKKTAEDILKFFHYPEEKAKKVLIIIGEHSTENIDKIQPSSIEAKILFDADKIDGMGATGIARVFSLFGQRGKHPLEAINWYKKK